MQAVLFPQADALPRRLLMIVETLITCGHITSARCQPQPCHVSARVARISRLPLRRLDDYIATESGISVRFHRRTATLHRNDSTGLNEIQSGCNLIATIPSSSFVPTIASAADMTSLAAFP